MKHRITPLLLAFGGALLLVGLGLSVSAEPPVTRMVTFSTPATACTDCHTAPHTNWRVAPHDLVLTHMDLTPTPACTACHDLNTPTLSIEHTVPVPPAVRLLALRGQLALAYAANPEWEAAAPVRTTEQAVAAQAEALLTVIEADTSWGFHSPAYLQRQLDEAEALLHMLTAFSS